ncbi:MAG: hypothetical protein LBV52_02620 [Spirochaetaceae bacterium]|jgi:hypothetical protein|nr:hypothetical protein [Spirochaetaceae bacterium]
MLIRNTFFYLPLIFFVCCATKPLVFYPAVDVYSANAVEIVNIDDFEELAKKSTAKTVYYTDAYFFVQIDGILYLHISRGYKNFREYREGKLKEPERWAIFKPGYSD